MSKELEAFERYLKDNYWNEACKKYQFNGYNDIQDTELDIYNRNMAKQYARDSKYQDEQTVKKALEELTELKKNVLELTIDYRTNKRLRHIYHNEIAELEELCKEVNEK